VDQATILTRVEHDIEARQAGALAAFAQDAAHDKAEEDARHDRAARVALAADVERTAQAARELGM
jgi:hypothetical protein